MAVGFGLPAGLAAGAQTAVTTAIAISLQSLLKTKVERCFFVNLDTGEEQRFLVNPTELDETYAANYARKAPLGFSHERMQYTGSPNARIPLTAFVDQIIFDERRNRQNIADAPVNSDTDEPNEVEQFRRFLLSLVTPRQGRRLASAAPTAVLFVWPGMIEMRVRITQLRFRHVHFQAGTPRARVYTAQMAIEEEPPERLFAQKVRRFGTIRPWAARKR